MEILSLLLLAVALAMDSFAVSISTGLVLQRIEIKAMGKISFLFALFQGAMPVVGWRLGLFFENQIKAIDHWVAFLLLSFIGGKMIFEAVKDESENKSINPYSFKNMAMLAIATSIDALAVGISFSLLGMDIAVPAVVIGITTFIFSFLGLTLGVKLGGFMGNKIEFLGGLILIGLGLKILLEHTLFQ